MPALISTSSVPNQARLVRQRSARITADLRADVAWRLATMCELTLGCAVPGSLLGHAGIRARAGALGLARRPWHHPRPCAEVAGLARPERCQLLLNTAWTVMVLCMEAMPIWFQVRPKSARLTWALASSQTSPASKAETAASNDNGLVRSRTVRVPDTVTPCLEGLIPSTWKVMSG